MEKQVFSLGELVKIKKTGDVRTIFAWNPCHNIYCISVAEDTPEWFFAEEIEPYSRKGQDQK